MQQTGKTGQETKKERKKEKTKTKAVVTIEQDDAQENES